MLTAEVKSIAKLVRKFSFERKPMLINCGANDEA